MNAHEDPPRIVLKKFQTIMHLAGTLGIHDALPESVRYLMGTPASPPNNWISSIARQIASHMPLGFLAPTSSNRGDGICRFIFNNG
jgi:hypothetical protein